MKINLDFYKSALILSWLSLLARLGECIKCVQCTTLRSRECEDGYVPPTECKPGMPYCIKYVGRLKAGAVVFRDCNNKHIENVCTMKVLGKDNSTRVRARVCYETCDWDGCNAGPLNSTTAQLHSNNSLHSYIIYGISLLSVVIITATR